MLLNLKKDFANGDVVSIKILNGDEIIARFESEDKDTVTISRPLALTMGAQGLGMIQWCFLGDADKITLSKSHVFFVVASKKDAAQQYMEGTTGIAMVK
jgi:hypothetical protein